MTKKITIAIDAMGGENAHKKMLPDIPISGWDVALTKEEGICLLEVNLSCNLFCNEYNKIKYNHFIHKWYNHLQNETNM